MSNTREYFFMADVHVAHSNVIQLSSRPYPNCQEMEDDVIRNTNKKVGANDVLFLVGDVCLGKKKDWQRFLSALTCRNIVLIKGNHDSWQQIPKDLVILVAEQMTIRAHNRLFLVSHYPYRVSWLRRFLRRLPKSLGSPRRPKDTGLWLLHGHNHRSTQLVDYHPRMFSVGVDANGFAPISITEIISKIQRRENA